VSTVVTLALAPMMLHGSAMNSIITSCLHSMRGDVSKYVVVSLGVAFVAEDMLPDQPDSAPCVGPGPGVLLGKS
jgi:hypothetical protein